MDYKQGDIYFYDPPTKTAAESESDSSQGALFVTSGSEQAGLRPYIIMSREVVHRNKPTVVGVPLTTRINKANSYRIKLPSPELIPVPGREAFMDSVALCDHVRVLDISRFRYKIGRLSDNAILGVGLGLSYVFDLR